MGLADAVVALLAGSAGGIAGRPVLDLDLDLAEAAHARLVDAVIAILDLGVDEIVLTVVHLHLGVVVVDLDGKLCRLRQRGAARLHLDALDTARVLRLRLTQRDLRILRKGTSGNRQGRGACLERRSRASHRLHRRSLVVAAAASRYQESGTGNQHLVSSHPETSARLADAFRF